MVFTLGLNVEVYLGTLLTCDATASKRSQEGPRPGLGWEQTFLACGGLNKVKCLPVSVIQGESSTWVAFHAQ